MAAISAVHMGYSVRSRRGEGHFNGLPAINSTDVTYSVNPIISFNSMNSIKGIKSVNLIDAFRISKQQNGLEPNCFCEFSYSNFDRKTRMKKRLERQPWSGIGVTAKVQLEEEQKELQPIRVNEDLGHSKEGEHTQKDRGWKAVLPHASTAVLANVCFGYHIGVINGPLDSISAELGFSGDAILEGFVVSVFLVGAFIGSAGGGLLADLVGRRRNFQLVTIPLILGSILSANAHSVGEIELGRFLVGIGVGAAAGFAPLYISEVSPTQYRGALGCLCQIGTCVGMIGALLLGVQADTDPHWWRAMFWIANVPALGLALGIQFASESPRWLAKMGRWEEADAVLSDLWGEAHVAVAMAELKEAEAESKEEASWTELLSPQYNRAWRCGAWLFALQQFAGVNGVLYFSAAALRAAGVATAAVGAASLAGALAVLPLMDTQGRRPLLMASYGGMAVSMAVMVAALVVPMPESVSHALTVTGTLGYVFLFALGAGPVTGLIIPELCSTRIRAKVVAASLCVHWVCNFVVGLFFLEAVQRFGLPAVYGAFGAVSVAAAAYARAGVVETRARSLEDVQRDLQAR